MTPQELGIANEFGHDLPGYITGDLPLPSEHDPINRGCVQSHLRRMLTEVARLRAELAASEQKCAELAAALELTRGHSIWCSSVEDDLPCSCSRGDQEVADERMEEARNLLGSRYQEQRRKGAVWALRRIIDQFASEYDRPWFEKMLSAIERGEVEVPND